MFPADYLLEPLVQQPAAYGLVFVLGLLFGSFANVCIYRWPPTERYPEGRSVVRPGSMCGACDRPVRWHDNVPLLSYALLRGRCRDCGASFSPRYLLVEAAMGMLFVAAYHHTVALPSAHELVQAPMQVSLATRMTHFLVLAAFQLVLVVIAFIDLDHKLILDKITYPAIPIFYGLGLLLPDQGWQQGLIGAAVGYGLIRLISDGYYYLTGREGLGYGDGKLLAMVGALMGWQAVVASLFLGSLLGTIITIPLVVLSARARQRGAAAGQVDAAAGAGDDEAEPATSLRHVEVPFGPFLIMGTLVYIYAQPWLTLALRVP